MKTPTASKGSSLGNYIFELAVIVLQNSVITHQIIFLEIRTS